MNLEILENALKKRWTYKYKWGRKQSNDWDELTNFIYNTKTFSSLLEQIKHFDVNLQNYALNRWYNFWSAMGVEYIFSIHKIVVPNINRYDKLVDFKINNIPFDHKTSIFPKGFGKPIEYAKKNKIEMIKWLYINQSQEGRKHLKNRLFIVLYDSICHDHWKLKAEIFLLKKAIDAYIEKFDKANLCKIKFGDDIVYSDIIWLER